MNMNNLAYFFCFPTSKWCELMEININIEMLLLRPMWGIESISQRSLAAVLLNYFSIG